MVNINIFSNTTLGEKLSEAQLRPSGFDYMRIILSIMVFLSHVLLTSYGDSAQTEMIKSPAGMIYKLILPMFFALSGFLVAGSLERCKTLISFLGLRAIRIYPALIVEVLLSALILGPLATNLTLQEYFSSPILYKYAYNFLGHPFFHLPGVFTDNPYPNIVNIQLWTIPWELYCYLSLSALFLLGIKKRKELVWYIIAGYICVFAGISIYKAINGTLDTTVKLDPVIHMNLIPYFLCGVGLYLFRDNIPFSPTLFWISTLLSLVLVRYVYFGEYICLLPVAYMTVFLGLYNPRRLAFIGAADYSYGIFLYGFVVEQAFVHFFPSLRAWYWNLLICLPVTTVIGMVSWYFFEKPALKLRPFLKSLEEMALRNFKI